MDWLRLGYLLTVPCAWSALAALAFAGVAAERRGGVPDGEPRPLSRRQLGALALLCLALALGRAVLATARRDHNVDEYEYAASAAFARHAGASLLGAHNFGLHQWLFLLGPWEAPFPWVDAAASLAVGLGAFLLGATLGREGLATAAAAALFHAAGLLRFEGLTSNKEPFVDLALAGWAYLRLGTPGLPSIRRRFGGGACLGLAAAFKEQALAFVLVEALVLAHEVRTHDVRAHGGRGLAPGRAVRAALLAGLGFTLGLGALVLPLAVRGELPAFLGYLATVAGTSAHPPAEVARVLEAPAPPGPPPADLLDWAVGLLPLWASPVGFLGLVGLLRVPFRLANARDPGRARRDVGAAALALTGIACASLGQRWFAHYFMLAVPGLALLGAREATAAARALRSGPASKGISPSRFRIPAAALLVVAAFQAALEVSFLSGPESSASGFGLPDDARARLEACARALRDHTPEGKRIVVWGWRPELYFAARRPPATHYVGGATATRARVLEDLSTLDAPAAFVLVGENGVWSEPGRDPFDLALHPPLVAWLREHGFRLAWRGEGYVVLAPR